VAEEAWPAPRRLVGASLWKKGWPGWAL
jgi:hypothetical protein